MKNAGVFRERTVVAKTEERKWREIERMDLSGHNQKNANENHCGNWPEDWAYASPRIRLRMERPVKAAEKGEGVLWRKNQDLWEIPCILLPCREGGRKRVPVFACQLEEWKISEEELFLCAHRNMRQAGYRFQSLDRRIEELQSENGFSVREEMKVHIFPKQREMDISEYESYVLYG